MDKENIVLIGFMCTGKSTVARILAERLSFRQVDADRIIAERQGMSIPEIFANFGESGFRKVESQILHEIMKQDRQVIATGGGAVLAAGNRRIMQENGWVVALSADQKVIIERALRDEDRPLLKGNVEARVASLLAERKDSYRFADFHVDTTTRSVEQIVTLILDAWKEVRKA